MRCWYIKLFDTLGSNEMKVANASTQRQGPKRKLLSKEFD
jgi:hypothetical protein